MQFRVQVHATEGGEYVAVCNEPQAYARGLSPTSALDKLRDEITYRLELCPCSGVEDGFVELDVCSSL